MTTQLHDRIQSILAEYTAKLVDSFTAALSDVAVSVRAPAEKPGRAPAKPQAAKPRVAKPRVARPQVAKPVTAKAEAEPVAAPAPKAKTAKKPGKIGSAADGRRLPHETEAHAQRFVEFVQANPGKRIRDIGAALGMATKDLALPAAKALKSGTVTKTGQRSATEYFPREVAAGGAGKSRARSKK